MVGTTIQNASVGCCYVSAGGLGTPDADDEENRKHSCIRIVSQALMMGFGDEIIGSGLARGAAARGKRIAFGDGRQIIWSTNAFAIFRGNPNVAPPGTGGEGIEWIHHYPGNRMYNMRDAKGSRWIWNYSFRVTPGELFFDAIEDKFAACVFPEDDRDIVIEPNVLLRKPWAQNKNWPHYQPVADALRHAGHRVVQFEYPEMAKRLQRVELFKSAANPRLAMAALSRARLYIGPEGGMHHAAAALGVPAVVIFGGFAPPSVLGYDGHINLTGGAESACGLQRPCDHCAAALDAIKPDDVITAAERLLSPC